MTYLKKGTIVRLNARFVEECGMFDYEAREGDVGVVGDMSPDWPGEYEVHLFDASVRAPWLLLPECFDVVEVPDDTDA